MENAGSKVELRGFESQFLSVILSEESLQLGGSGTAEILRFAQNDKAVFEFRISIFDHHPFQYNSASDRRI